MRIVKGPHVKSTAVGFKEITYGQEYHCACLTSLTPPLERCLPRGKDGWTDTTYAQRRLRCPNGGQTLFKTEM